MLGRIKYKIKPFLNWQPIIRKHLRNLTFGYRVGSGMLDSVSENQNPITCVAFLNDEIVGWSLISCKQGSFYLEGTIMVYVKRAYRRNGIACCLVNKLIKKYKAKTAIAHSKSSCCFWKEFFKNNVNTGIGISGFYYDNG